MDTGAVDIWYQDIPESLLKGILLACVTTALTSSGKLIIPTVSDTDDRELYVYHKLLEYIMGVVRRYTFTCNLFHIYITRINP